VSGLHGKLEEYLTVRRAMGFKMERHEKLLAQFAAAHWAARPGSGCRMTSGACAARG